MSQHVIRASFSRDTVRVYQAYREEIAEAALAAGKFVPPFSMGRMTWIKPSFNWMMYRCGFGSKPGQEVVLGIDITRDGFEWALEHAVLPTLIRAFILPTMTGAKPWATRPCGYSGTLSATGS